MAVFQHGAEINSELFGKVTKVEQTGQDIFLHVGITSLPKAVEPLFSTANA